MSLFPVISNSETLSQCGLLICAAVEKAASKGVRGEIGPIIDAIQTMTPAARSFDNVGRDEEVFEILKDAGLFISLKRGTVLFSTDAGDRGQALIEYGSADWFDFAEMVLANQNDIEVDEIVDALTRTR